MANLVLPPPERRIAANKPIAPIAIDPPQLGETEGIGPWKSLNDVVRVAAKIREMAKNEAYWVTDPQIEIPTGTITDLDYCLSLVASAWVEAYASRTGIYRARGFQEGTYWAVDTRESVIPHGVGHPLNRCLVSYWGKRYDVSARYPNNFEKPFLNNLRKLGTAGFLVLTKPLNDAGFMRYLVAPSQRGLIRAVWIAGITHTPDPLKRVLALPAEALDAPSAKSSSVLEESSAPSRHDVVMSAIAGHQAAVQKTVPTAPPKTKKARTSSAASMPTKSAPAPAKGKPKASGRTRKRQS
jgi:hypothetical protein